MINPFDIETYRRDNNLIPYCVCVVLNNNAFSFYGKSCIDDFRHFILEQGYNKLAHKPPIVLFPHNLTFDGSVLIRNIKNSRNFSYGGLFVRGNIYSFELYHNNIRIVFKCSYRYFLTSLSNAHKLLQTDMNIEFNHSLIYEISIDLCKEKTIKYCKRDAVMVTQIIKKKKKLDLTYSVYMPNWIKIHIPRRQSRLKFSIKISINIR